MRLDRSVERLQVGLDPAERESRVRCGRYAEAAVGPRGTSGRTLSRGRPHGWQRVSFADLHDDSIGRRRRLVRHPLNHRAAAQRRLRHGGVGGWT